jgi:hypothetical protein
LAGANPSPHVTGRDELPGKSNYFVGNDPARWRTNVPAYARVHYRDVYPGVDLVYYGNQGQLEYDFVVAAGADPGRIRMSFDGARDIRIDARGDLMLHVAGGDLRQHKPVVYQEVAGVRQQIAGRYVMKGKGQVGFELGAYDETRPLVIDPVLVYSTYLGGAADDPGNGIAVDAVGNAYVTGSTTSNDFPVTIGAFDTTRAGQDAFVVKRRSHECDPQGSLVRPGRAAPHDQIQAAPGFITPVGSAFITHVGSAFRRTRPEPAEAGPYVYAEDGQCHDESSSRPRSARRSRGADKVS